MTRAIGLAAALACAGVVTAQGAEDPQDEWLRTKRLLEQSRSEVDRLVDMRFRHDLGLPPEPDPTMPRSNPISTIQKERMLRELREQDGHTASLLSRFNTLKREVESLRAEAEARQARAQEEAFVVVPSAGTAQRSARDRPAPAVNGNRGGVDAPGSLSPAAGGAQEPAPLPAASSPAVRLGRVRGQIRGSNDHLRVAQSLFAAGQALMDAARLAREEGDDAAAADLDGRARLRLERAVAELEPLLAAEEPAYAALFCKGRCLELLFRYSVRYEGLSLKRSTKLFQQREQEVREPFLAISARDVQKTGERGDVEVLGSWGMAANAAVEHFRWMNQHGSYRPVTPIESITWPGEKDR